MINSSHKVNLCVIHSYGLGDLVMAIPFLYSLENHYNTKGLKVFCVESSCLSLCESIGINASKFKPFRTAIKICKLAFEPEKTIVFHTYGKDNLRKKLLKYLFGIFGIEYVFQIKNDKLSGSYYRSKWNLELLKHEKLKNYAVCNAHRESLNLRSSIVFHDIESLGSIQIDKNKPNAYIHFGSSKNIDKELSLQIQFRILKMYADCPTITQLVYITRPDQNISAFQSKLNFKKLRFTSMPIKDLLKLAESSKNNSIIISNDTGIGHLFGYAGVEGHLFLSSKSSVSIHQVLPYDVKYLIVC